MLLLRSGIFCLLVSLSAGCGHGTFTQTFRDQDDSTRTLSLISDTGFGVRPASNFPGNLLFKIFGTNELVGTYVMQKGDSQVKGRFLARKDENGEEQWIKFVSDDNQEWQGKIVGRDLVGPGKVWIFEIATADAKTAASVKIGE